MRRKFTKENDEEIIKLFNEGKTCQEISVRISREPTSVKYRLLKLTNYNPPGLRKYHCDFDFFEKIDTQEKAYWLGFICGDGNVSKNCLHIGVQVDDSEHLRQLMVHMKGNYPVREKKYISRGKDSWIARIDIHYPKICSDLLKYGVAPNKTGKMSWALIKKGVPDDLIVHFIRGFFDADGSWKRGHKGDRVFNIGEKGGQIVSEILLILKTQVTDTKSNIQIRPNNFHVVEVGGRNNTCNIAKWIYKDSTIRLERKFVLVEPFIQNS